MRVAGQMFHLFPARAEMNRMTTLGRLALCYYPVFAGMERMLPL